MTTVTTFFQHSIGSPRHRNQTRKINTLGKEEVKILAIAGDRMLHMEDP